MTSSLIDLPFVGNAITFALSLTVFFACIRLTSTRLHLPPGPKPAPLIGNLFQVSADFPEVSFKKWANKFGEIIYIHFLGKPTIILSSIDAARDLLEKRGSVYSDRPRFVLFSELMGWHGASTHVRYGPKFRMHRRFIHQIFNHRSSPAFRPLQRQETITLLDSLISSPELYVQHFRRFAAATILMVTYGHKINSVDDLFVRLAERATTLTVEAGTPAATLVDYIPLMKYIPTWAPFSGFKRRALETREAVDQMMNVPFDMVKNDMRSGKATPSFTSTLLEAYCDPGNDAINSEVEEDIKGAAGTLYAAAEDTTVAVMETFMLAMARHPDVLKKAQAEMDAVTGKKRLPTFDDRSSLPYLESVLKEVFRWNPPVPLGLPHRLMEDDVYRSYHIPKGSSVIANILAMLHDCPNPYKFLPERYTEDPQLLDPRELAFGFGRRRCPGRHFAHDSTWLMVAGIVAALDISGSKGDENRELAPDRDLGCGFVRHPKPFECLIRPRTEAIISMIHNEKQTTRYPGFTLRDDNEGPVQRL